MSAPFEAPVGLRFTCTRCGDCCRGWNVMLGPGEEERLAAFDWRGREADLDGALTVVDSTLPGGQRARRLAHRQDGACVYLGSDHQCRIHRHFGGEAKPLMCRLYPFGFYPMGGRVAVDVSFACRSIRQGSGEPVGERNPEWVAWLERGANAVEAPHRLTRERPIPGGLVWEIEHVLLGFLAREDLSLFDRIRCCLRFMRLATTGDPATPAAAKLRQAIAQGLPRQISAIPRGGGMDRTQKAVFYQWLFLSLNPVPPGFDRLGPREQKREKKRRLRAAQSFASEEGPPWLDNEALELGFAELEAIDASLFDSRRIPALERYLTAKIVGQRFLMAGGVELPLVEAVPLFFLTFPMAIWSSRALAARRGAARVEEGELREALALLDRALGEIPLDSLPAAAAKAWRFVVGEMDLPVAATNELLGWEEPEEATDEESLFKLIE